VLPGVVKSVQMYDVFVDLGGAAGLLQSSQISHAYVSPLHSPMKLGNIFSKGDKVKVNVCPSS
jgi:ribosomal protein S1